MSRSLWKGPFIDPSLIKVFVKHVKSDKSKIIKTRSRSSVIIPAFVGNTFGVYNGKKYIPVLVTEEMVGHKLGEFSPTRIYYGHTVGDKKLKSKKG